MVGEKFGQIMCFIIKTVHKYKNVLAAQSESLSFPNLLNSFQIYIRIDVNESFSRCQWAAILHHIIKPGLTKLWWSSRRPKPGAQTGFLTISVFMGKVCWASVGTEMRNQGKFKHGELFKEADLPRSRLSLWASLHPACSNHLHPPR